jgi:hypothetical protein
MLLRWISGIGTAFRGAAGYFLRPMSVPSNVADETSVESAAAETKAPAESEFVQETQVSVAAINSPDEQEIQRRRELVRALFNDFWSGIDDKPVTFVERFNQAENYLNERLTACGEPWQLNANTRKLLGLPRRSN